MPATASDLLFGPYCLDVAKLFLLRNIWLLRRAIEHEREHYIETVPRRGYGLMVPVPVRRTAAVPAPSGLRARIPGPLSALIGRTREMHELVELAEWPHPRAGSADCRRESAFRLAQTPPSPVRHPCWRRRAGSTASVTNVCFLIVNLHSGSKCRRDEGNDRFQAGTTSSGDAYRVLTSPLIRARRSPHSRSGKISEP